MPNSAFDHEAISPHAGSLATVKPLEILLAEPAADLDSLAEEPGPLVIDWDQLLAERQVASCECV